jgi:SpoVK/Ycf46/Vps4 family AAA+-type ATPase
MIKNSWLSSLGMMVQRGGDSITKDDLSKAAGEQVVGQLSMEAFDRRVVPTHGIEALVVPTATRDALSSIVDYKKAQSVLFGNWGFDKLHRSTLGVSAMFTGKPGTGKTMAAEAIGYEIGSPLLVVNVAELVSKWVGETGKNIEGIFADASKKDAVLVFDEAEGLLGSRRDDGASTSRHDNMNVGLLLHYIENFNGICIVITNLKDAIDEAFFRRFRFVLDFEEPDAAAREQIWKRMVPENCPLDPKVSFRDLANRFNLCGGNIKQALLRAATKAALRTDGKKRVVTMKDLEVR